MRRIAILALLFLIKGQWLYSQTNATYTTFVKSLQGVGIAPTNISSLNTLNFSVTDKAGNPSSLIREKNKSATLYMKLDMGNDYIKQDDPTWNFLIQVSVSYQFTGFTPVVKTLTISSASPEIIKLDDVLANFATSSPPLLVSITSTVATDLNNNPIANTLLTNYINGNLRFTATLAREYQVDVRTPAPAAVLATAPTVSPVTIANRLATFKWQPTNAIAYPDYELQVLRLDNTDPTLQTNQNQIAATVDWSSALKIETQSFETTFNLTIGEGSGYYIWRVRPIGNYFDGGISNSENYGQWSYSFSDGSQAALDKSTLLSASNPSVYAFYFTDPDEDINWIYNRVFTEGDNYDKTAPTGVKTSEGMSYADGLQRVRQNQKYNSSDNTNIVSQTINDYSGRPALTTMPVPVNGGLNGYKLGFVKNSSNNLYTAESFDEDANITSPSTIKDNGTDFAYYSANPTTTPNNKNVPDARGYAFKRTVFTTDGTGRVAEESGVGKRHALGTQTSGMGRTKRTMYCAPSDDELIRIFGDEAPLAESVIKTITIDENNVMSVTYTSKEGKTIATALSTESTDNLSPLSTVSQSLTVSNSIKQNISSGGKLVGSKRVAVPADNTTLTISYLNSSLAPAGGCVSGECNFRMRLYLIDLNRGMTYVSDANPGTAGIQDFSVAAGSTLTTGWTFTAVSTNTSSAPSSITPDALNEIVVNAGEYVFIKELYSGNSPQYAESLINTDNALTKPIFDAIANKMIAVTSPAENDVFNTFMSTLKTAIDDYHNNANGVTTETILALLGLTRSDFPATPTYSFPMTFSLSSISTNTDDPTLGSLQINTGCCGVLNVTVPKNPVCYVCDGSPLTSTVAVSMSSMTTANDNASTATITPYGINDFKADGSWNGTSTSGKLAAIHSLVNREFILPLINKLAIPNPTIPIWQVAPGFSYESLNFMISNMLISQYYTGTAIKDGSSWYAATVAQSGGYSLGAQSLSLTSSGYDYNYDCQKLADSWANALELMGSFDTDNDQNVLGGFNDADGQNSGQNNADDDSNYDGLSKRKKKKLKKALSKNLEDFANSPDGQVTGAQQNASTNLIENFLMQVGYQFAAIVDGSPLPNYLSTTTADIPDDYLTSTVTAIPISPTLTPVFTLGSNTFGDSPYLFSLDITNAAVITTVNCASAANGTTAMMYYPYMVKPEWMFKYFTYNVYGSTYISDGSTLLPHQVMVDIQRQYNPPADYLAAATTTAVITGTDLCTQPPVISYTNASSVTSTVSGYFHMNWTAQERYYFYEAVKGAPRCPDSKGIPAGGDLFDYSVAQTDDPLPTCESKSDLIADAKADLQLRIDNCNNLYNEIKNALTSELINSCYSIVDCKSGPTSSTGEVTEKDINAMVLLAIQSATDVINTVKANFDSMTSVTGTACLAPATPTDSYSTDVCQLPYCTQTDCHELVLQDNNVLTTRPGRRLATKFYTDCDQKILDMISLGTFLPEVAPFGTCPNKPTKEWKTGCGTPVSCGPNDDMDRSNYSEKSCGSNTAYEKYSKTYTVSAGN